MQLQFQSSLCRCMECVARDTAAQEATQEVKITDGMPDIGRVLASWGQMIIRTKEWRGDTVTANGGIMVWILYDPEDGTGPRCVESWIPWQLRWERLESDREGPVRISPMLRFLDARVVSPRKFMVRAGAAALAEAFCQEEYAIYRPGELPHDLELYRRTYPMRLPREAGEKTFQCDEELTMDGPVPEKILAYTVWPTLTESRVLTNRILFRGCCNLHLIYRCSEGRIRVADFEVPFSQYAELTGSYDADARGDVRFAVINLELNQEEQLLRLKCAMVAQYLIDDREMVELVEDAYSPRRSVSVNTQMLHLPALLESKTEAVPVTARAGGTVGDVVDISTFPDFPRQRQTADGVAFEISGISHILGYDESGTLRSAAVRWDTGYEMKAGEDSLISGQVMGEGPFQAVSSGDGTELRGKLQLRTDTTSGSGMTIVTGLELGEEEEQTTERPSLILCRPAGENLWQLAKRCGSTMEAIREANGIQEELDQDRMLLIPVW